MKSVFTKFALSAILGFALSLTFSCSSDKDDDNSGGGGENVLSSSSGRSSSSVAPTDCIGFVEGTQREHYGKSKPQFCDARDGKRYVYVQMGTKTWMAENLNYKANGSVCYGGEEVNCNTYGRLYDWNTAKTACPSGWHLPTDDDWNDLMKFINPICTDYKETYVCSDAGTKLKTASGWYITSGIPKGTDDYGFAALPGGFDYYDDDDGDYYYNALGEWGQWWTASEYDLLNADVSAIQSKDEDVMFGYIRKVNLSSVRCVKGNAPPPNSSSSYKAVSSSSEKEQNNCSAEDNDDYEYCSNGIAMEEYDFVTDKDGQDYKTVKIGKQTWMAENLNYAAIGSYCGDGTSVTDENTETCDTYGRLYNWATAKTVCPSGWRLPSDADWNVLMKFVNPSCSDNSRCDGAGTRLKSINNWYLQSDDDGSSGNGTDRYGFAALPGGEYSISTLTNSNCGGGDRQGSWTPGQPIGGNCPSITTTIKLFSNAGSDGYWWSSSENASNAYLRTMSRSNEYVDRLGWDKNNHYLSVRCIKD